MFKDVLVNVPVSTSCQHLQYSSEPSNVKLRRALPGTSVMPKVKKIFNFGKLKSIVDCCCSLILFLCSKYMNTGVCLLRHKKTGRPIL